MQCFGTATAISAGIQMLEGLEDLHNIGYLHRDVKPGNVTIGRQGETHKLYILDFGMARCYVRTDVSFEEETSQWEITWLFRKTAE
jgi:tau tubulin kinase